VQTPAPGMTQDLWSSLALSILFSALVPPVALLSVKRTRAKIGRPERKSRRRKVETFCRPRRYCGVKSSVAEGVSRAAETDWAAATIERAVIDQPAGKPSSCYDRYWLLLFPLFLTSLRNSPQNLYSVSNSWPNPFLPPPTPVRVNLAGKKIARAAREYRSSPLHDSYSWGFSGACSLFILTKYCQ